MKKTNHTRMRSIGKKGSVKSDLAILGTAAIVLIISFLTVAFGAEVVSEIDADLSSDAQDVTGNLTDGLKTFAKFAGIISLLVIIVVVIKLLRNAAKK